MATIYASRGENDKAFDYLERAYSEKSPDLHGPLNSDIQLDGLHSDPRFQNLLLRTGVND